MIDQLLNRKFSKISVDSAQRKNGPGYLTYNIAELSANHHQNFDQTVKILEAADAVRLNIYAPDTWAIDKGIFGRVVIGSPRTARTSIPKESTLRTAYD